MAAREQQGDVYQMGCFFVAFVALPENTGGLRDFTPKIHLRYTKHCTPAAGVCKISILVIFFTFAAMMKHFVMVLLMAAKRRNDVPRPYPPFSENRHFSAEPEDSAASL